MSWQGNVYTDLWGWAFTLVVIVLLAWFGWRQHRKSKEDPE